MGRAYHGEAEALHHTAGMVHALMHVHVLKKLIINLTTHDKPVLMQDTLLFGVQQLFHLRVSTFITRHIK